LIDTLRLWTAGNDNNKVVKTCGVCTVESTEYTRWQGNLFDTSHKKAEVCTYIIVTKNHFRQTFTVKNEWEQQFIPCIKDMEQWLQDWNDTHLVFDDHHNYCLNPTRPADFR
jgi:hypothetical protein